MRVTRTLPCLANFRAQARPAKPPPTITTCASEPLRLTADLLVNWLTRQQFQGHHSGGNRYGRRKDRSPEVRSKKFTTSNSGPARERSPSFASGRCEGCTFLREHTTLDGSLKLGSYTGGRGHKLILQAWMRSK